MSAIDPKTARFSLTSALTLSFGVAFFLRKCLKLVILSRSLRRIAACGHRMLPLPTGRRELTKELQHFGMAEAFLLKSERIQQRPRGLLTKTDQTDEINEIISCLCTNVPAVLKTYRIMITLRFRARHWREIRRNQNQTILEGTRREKCFQQQALFLTRCL